MMRCVLYGLHWLNCTLKKSGFKKCTNVLNMTGNDYSVTVNSITKFEVKYPSILINVFSCEDDEEIYSLRITKCKGNAHNMNLLLLSDAQGGKLYCLITKLSRLLSILTKHDGAVLLSLLFTPFH